MTDPAPAIARTAVHSLAGLAVVLVMLQSSGGLTVELPGPDMLLTVAGFALTFAALTDADGHDRAAGWREALAARAPLPVLTVTLVLAVGTLTERGARYARDVVDAMLGVVGVGTWNPRPADPGAVDPLGPLWLVALLALFALAWPPVLHGLRRALSARSGARAPATLTAVLAAAAAAAWLVGPLRALTGAGLDELARGAHVRLAEWLVGAAAAALVVAVGPPGSRAWPGRVAGRAAEPRRRAVLRRAGVLRRGVVLRRAGLLPRAGVLTTAGVALLVVSTWWATVDPAGRLALGGTAVAAAGTAALLLGLHARGGAAPARQLARGAPAELGRMAFPLLVLHAPMYLLVQLAVPDARPLALLVVGGALAWLVGLVVQDGIVGRWRARGTAVPRALVTGALAVALTGSIVAVGGPDPHVAAAAAPSGSRPEPVVLVFGAAAAGDLADGLERAGVGVVDATRPGCGLLPGPPTAVTRARLTADAQIPAGSSDCGDWPTGWYAAVGTDRPDAVLIDPSVDLRRPGVDPCDPGFRTRYRALLRVAVTVATSGGPQRPVLLATARADAGPAASVHCYNALVDETAGTYREVLRLDVHEQLCPDAICRSHTLAGDPLFDGPGRLTAAARAELGRWLASEVARLRPTRP
ncbi:MAG: hypothetical protein ACT4RN_07980 [Pseudonocardia sp.]